MYYSVLCFAIFGGSAWRLILYISVQNSDGFVPDIIISKLCTVHHRVLLRIIGAQRKRPDHRMTSYNRALEMTRCETIETTLRKRRLLRAGTLLRMSGGRLPKRIIFGNLEGAVRRGRGGREKEWIDCVQSDIRAFGITEDWKAMALKAEV